MMLHSLRKECSALLCEAVQGEFLVSVTNCIQFAYFAYEIARIDDNDPRLEKDHWKKKRKITEVEEPLRADRWFFKNMEKKRDEPEQSGQKQSF